VTDDMMDGTKDHHDITGMMHDTVEWMEMMTYPLNQKNMKMTIT